MHDLKLEKEYPPVRVYDGYLNNQQMGILPIISNPKTDVDSEFLNGGLK